MRTSILSLALLAAPILAFTIPEGQADGIYSVSYVDGKEVHTLVDSITSDDATSSAGVKRSVNSAKFRNAKRDNYSCGGDHLNPGDTDAANNDIDNQCGNNTGWIPGNQDFYSIHGCTVAYACNFGALNQPCSMYNRQAASAGITATCGLYNSGWLNAGTGSISYGYEDFCKYPGSNFCGRGTG